MKTAFSILIFLASAGMALAQSAGCYGVNCPDGSLPVGTTTERSVFQIQKAETYATSSTYECPKDHIAVRISVRAFKCEKVEIDPK